MAQANQSEFRVEHVAETPAGWHVRTKPMQTHEVRIAFPPGRRRRGAGRLVEILHPASERNPRCAFGQKIRANPIEELIVFGNPKRRGRKNQEEMPVETEQAVRLFEGFHGRAPEEILELQRSATMRLDYTALGELVAIGLGQPEQHGGALVNHWDKENCLTFEGDDVKLASAPNGEQLYLIGGNQDCSDCFDAVEGLDEQKDLIDLGDAGFVVYDARKAHSNFEPVEWIHEFGEEGGTLPRLLYDRLRRELFFAGGNYTIQIPADGVSPGIEN